MREIRPTPPKDGFGLLECSDKYEFIYLSSRSHPDFVAYRMKDICNPDDCACDIKISHLDSRRSELSVPWEKAGNILPAGVSHW